MVIYIARIGTKGIQSYIGYYLVVIDYSQPNSIVSSMRFILAIDYIRITSKSNKYSYYSLRAINMQILY